MQRIFSITKAMSCLTAVSAVIPKKITIVSSYFSTFSNHISRTKLLQTFVPIANSTCGMKVKGRVKRRCKSCYLVFRDERAYIMCKAHPRHKQMAMKAKPHNTWILTHASQSPVRPW